MAHLWKSSWNVCWLRSLLDLRNLISVGIVLLVKTESPTQQYQTIYNGGFGTIEDGFDDCGHDNDVASLIYLALILRGDEYYYYGFGRAFMNKLSLSG